jgi:uncharacterized membrane protein YhdT
MHTKNFVIVLQMLGLVCICSFVYLMGQDVCVSTVVLRWFEDQDVYSYRLPLLFITVLLTYVQLGELSAQRLCSF